LFLERRSKADRFSFVCDALEKKKETKGALAVLETTLAIASPLYV
jgi:hypothetical protein